jgi:LacI family transcriptional regulator
MERLVRPTVTILIETSREYARGLCRGISDYAANHGGWNLVFKAWDLHGGIPTWLVEGKPDGIICRLPNLELAEILTEMSIPVVDLHGQVRHPRIPFLDTDAERVAEMAISFFRASAFTRFAYCGFPGVWFSDERGAAFRRQLREIGFEVDFYEPPEVWESLNVAEREGLHPSGSADLQRWVANLPSQTAVLACNDVCGQQLVSVAARVGRKVPEEIAVLGVDNDEVLCHLSSPTLSSIQPDTRGLGYTAAYWLDQMMRGNKQNWGSLYVAPTMVCERGSTDVIASQDTVFAAAVRYIRGNVEAGIDVSAVVENSGYSRSTLESRFKRLLGRSVKDEITRFRVCRARMLLQETEMTIESVAAASGFANASHFSRIFKEQVGATPGSFRQKCGRLVARHAEILSPKPWNHPD